jgi:hypothetical protein
MPGKSCRRRRRSHRENKKKKLGVHIHLHKTAAVLRGSAPRQGWSSTQRGSSRYKGTWASRNKTKNNRIQASQFQLPL